MSTGPDLTRWNRAGLARLRYVDGNAVDFLEQLRAELAARFQTWTAIQAPAGETAAARRERLARQYDAPPTDWAWEIARAFARACHVLGEHLDAYANEGYLRTAGEWDSVRRLVALLDLQPAPPASASTPLALAAKGEPGLLAPGFAVRHTPADGSPPIAFETLEELALDPALNRLRPAGWNLSPARLDAPPPLLWREPANAGISAGQVALLVHPGSAGGEEAAVVRVDRLAATGALALTPVANQPDWPAWTRGTAALLARPRVIAVPRLAGSPGALRCTGPHGLAAGEVVAWPAGSSWAFATVDRADERALLLAGDARPAAGLEVFRALFVERDGQGLFLPLGHRAAAAAPAAGGLTLLGAGDLTEVRDPLPPPNGTLRMYSVRAGIDRVAYVPGTVPAAGRVAAEPPADGKLRFDGKPGLLESGQWLVGDDGSRLVALRIALVEALPDHFALSFAVAGYTLTHLDHAYGAFQHTLRPADAERDDTPLAGSRLTLESPPPPLLGRGRQLLLERLDPDGAGAAYARPATVLAVDGPTQRLDLGPPLRADEGFTVGNLVLHANVARAGHGEGKPEKILGSGDATRRSPRLVLAQEGVAWIADPAQPAGVAAAVTVTVGGQVWRQVARLGDSGPTDPHYEASLTEDGFLAFTFGDGRHGRLLPTGTDNVRVRWRTGTGLAGNLPAGRLEKPAQPHPRVAAVRQLLPATGGNDRQEAAELKAQAPASVLTLDRAVSLADFAALAARQASVWQARAFALPTGFGRLASLEVVVVPAGGGELGPLAADLASFLTTRAVPGVDLTVTPYEARPFHLAVEVEADSAQFDLDAVEKSVEAALLAAFGLRRRALGAPLYASDLYALVEGVAGVETSLITRLTLADDDTGAARVLRAGDRQVIFLDPARSRLIVTARELTP